MFDFILFRRQTGVSTLTPQQHQQFQQVAAAVANQQQQNQNSLSHQAHGIQTANTLPLLVSYFDIEMEIKLNRSLIWIRFFAFSYNQQAQLQVSPQQQQQLINKQATMNPEINALMTSIIHSANQLQQQTGQ